MLIIYHVLLRLRYASQYFAATCRYFHGDYLPRSGRMPESVAAAIQHAMPATPYCRHEVYAMLMLRACTPYATYFFRRYVARGAMSLRY